MEADEPIEIELTPLDAGRSKPRRSVGASIPEPPIPQPDGLSDEEGTSPGSGDDSRRAFAMTVGVGLAALVVGLVIGRATTNDSEAVATDGTERRPPATTVSATDSSLRAEEVEPVATTTEARVELSTTTVVAVELETISIDPVFAGVPYELVGLEWDGDLVEIDLSTGERTIRRDLDLSAGGGPSALWAGDGWVIAPDWNADTTVLIEDGEDPVRPRIGPPWQLMESATSGEFWKFEQSPMIGTVGVAQLVDRHGQSVGAPIELSAPPLFSDPGGGIIVEASGGSYTVNGDGASKVVDGTLLALDGERAVARTCDDQLRCGYVVVDRATGLSTPLQTDLPGRYVQPYWPVSDATRIAPDGHTIAILWFDESERQVLGLLDLEHGTTTVVSDASDGTVRWSPDGRFAFYLEIGLPMAHEIATGDSFLVAGDLGRLNSLAVRPRSDG